MKYLKFLSQNNSHQDNYFKSIFAFIISNSVKRMKAFQNSDIKSIEVRHAGREDASLRAQYNNYKLEPAFFTIAKNYIQMLPNIYILLQNHLKNFIMR